MHANVPVRNQHAARLHPVDQDIQTQPNHIHKVPVPSSAFKAEVTRWREMPFLQTQGDEQQHQHADEHMETMETGQHEEG